MEWPDPPENTPRALKKLIPEYLHAPRLIPAVRSGIVEAVVTALHFLVRRRALRSSAGDIY